jgi:hypothetical protein
MPDVMLTWRCTKERYGCPHFVPNFMEVVDSIVGMGWGTSGSCFYVKSAQMGMKENLGLPLEMP